MNTRNILPKGESKGSSPCGCSWHSTHAGTWHHRCQKCPNCDVAKGTEGTIVMTNEPTPPSGNASEGEQVHLSHCFQGEYSESCKYGDTDCPAAPSSHYVRVCNCPKHDCPVHGEQPETITTVASTAPIDQTEEKWKCVGCGQDTSQNPWCPCAKDSITANGNPQASEEVEPWADWPPVDIEKTLSGAKARLLFWGENQQIVSSLTLDMYRAAKQLQRERDEYKQFYERHNVEEPWDGSTFVDLTPDCECIPCERGRFWIKHLQELAQKERDECHLYKQDAGRAVTYKGHLESELSALFGTEDRDIYMQKLPKFCDDYIKAKVRTLQRIVHELSSLHHKYES